MKKLLIFLLLSLISAFKTKAQNVNEEHIKADVDKLKQELTKQSKITKSRIDESLNLYTSNKSSLVTTHVFDSLMVKYQNQISGTFIKNGKSKATSAYTDGKSLTANVNAATIKISKVAQLLLQPTLTATADSGIVNILTGGNYNQNAFSGGVNFFVFTNNSHAKYYQSDKVQLHNAIKAYDLSIDTTVLYERNFDRLNKLFIALDREKDAFYKTDAPITKNLTKEGLVAFESLRKLLELYLPKGFDDLPYEAEVKFLLGMKPNIEAIARQSTNQYKLDILDSLQKKAYWSRVRMNWLSGSVKYNVSENKLFDVGKPDDLFTRNYYDKYVSFSLAYNWFTIRKKVNIWFAPTLTFKNSRSFDPKDKTNGLINVQRNEPYPVGAETLNKVKTTSFYKEKAEVKDVLTAEIPLGIYFHSTGLGFDITPGFQIVPKITDLSLKTGVFFPFDVSEKTTLTIEPFAKFQKLFQGLNFNKEVFSIGISLSATLPVLSSSKL